MQCMCFWTCSTQQVWRISGIKWCCCLFLLQTLCAGWGRGRVQHAPGMPWQRAPTKQLEQGSEGSPCRCISQWSARRWVVKGSAADTMQEAAVTWSCVAAQRHQWGGSQTRETCPFANETWRALFAGVGEASKVVLCTYLTWMEQYISTISDNTDLDQHAWAGSNILAFPWHVSSSSQILFFCCCNYPRPVGSNVVTAGDIGEKFYIVKEVCGLNQYCKIQLRPANHQ